MDRGDFAKAITAGRLTTSLYLIASGKTARSGVGFNRKVQIGEARITTANEFQLKCLTVSHSQDDGFTIIIHVLPSIQVADKTHLLDFLTYTGI
jgi:hypothetical protein